MTVVQTIKIFSGHSGSQVYLLKENNKTFVRKINNINRNVERYRALNNIVNIPKLYNISGEVLDMEYIHGLDMKQYIKYHNIDALISWLSQTLTKFNNDSVVKDYTEIYYTKLDWLNYDNNFDFTADDLIKLLPPKLPCSCYHGDFTFDNIIFGNDHQFYLIDPLTSEYDSWVFDLSKLRQDLESKWFVRNQNYYLDTELLAIQNKLFKTLEIPKNDYLLILMLLRVYPYTKPNSLEQNLIKKEISRLWK